LIQNYQHLLITQKSLKSLKKCLKIDFSVFFISLKKQKTSKSFRSEIL